MWPLPISVIQALDTATKETTARNIAIRNLNSVAFFLLLRPGKYCKGSTETVQHPFRLKEDQFFIGQHPHNAATASNSVLTQADFVRLLFTTQKNCIKGGSIVHGRTGHTKGCPLASMLIQLEYLQLYGATGNTPLSSYKKGTKWQQIREDDITAAIRAVVRSAGPSIGFTETDIIARSLCAGGVMALLMTQMDPGTIRLVRRWRSDKMICYLQTKAKSFTKGLVAKMFEHDAYALIPSTHSSN